MSFRNARMSVRKAMLVVMAAAILLGLVQATRRWIHFRRLAALHANEERSARAELQFLEELGQNPRYRFLRDLQGERVMIEGDNGGHICVSTPWTMRRLVNRHARLKDLYTNAAWQPWDTPNPEEEGDVLGVGLTAGRP
jgi:hypothetical protein